MINPLITLVRHGHTAGNDKNTYRGWSNGPDAQLNPEGRDDIREAGIFLKGTGLTFPIIISDDLDRAVESRKILADILGIKEQETDKRLRPLNVGDFTGQDKLEHPLEKYMDNPNLRIPGGESLNQFNRRQSLVFSDLLALIEKIHNPVLIVSHGSNVCYLHNHATPKQSAEEKIGYEGLVYPGGVLVFTSEGIIPLTKKREGAPVPLKDGTAVSGFVTDEENVPPRECWNCRWVVKGISQTFSCTHPVVRIDPKLQARKQTDGTIAVSDRDCCDSFQNKIAT